MGRSRRPPRPIRVLKRLARILVHSLKLGDGIRQKALLLYILLRWQLMSAIGPRARLPSPRRINLKFKRVKLSIVGPDDDIGLASVIYEVFVREDYKVDLGRPPACILDVGANYGLASLYFAATYPTAIIHALEPGARNFEVLSRNTRSFPNVRPHRVGLFSRTGKATLYEHGSGILSSLVVRGSRTEEVDLMTLDDFLAAQRIEHVDVMKLDVEGAEEEIITATRSLERVDAIVGELHLDLIRKDRLLARLDPYFLSHCEDIGPGVETIVARGRRIERAS
jgi:FkbM family methyltransferase